MLLTGGYVQLTTLLTSAMSTTTVTSTTTTPATAMAWLSDSDATKQFSTWLDANYVLCKED